LPEPAQSLYDDATGLPHFSEAQALRYVKHYSEDIGYRIVGTPEMDESVKYTLQVIEDLKSQIPAGANVEIDVSHQQGDGSHLFELVGKVRLTRG
jgi:hypothetical protein